MFCRPLPVCILGTAGHAKSRVMKCMCSWSDLLQAGEGMSDAQGFKLCVCKCACACMCMQLLRGGEENGESWGGGGRCLVLVVQWTPDRDCFLSTGPASSLWLLPGQWLGNYEECLETISFFWAHGWGRRGWMAFLCLFLFFIFSRLDRQVAVATTRRRSPAHLHHKQGVLPTQT